MCSAVANSVQWCFSREGYCTVMCSRTEDMIHYSDEFTYKNRTMLSVFTYWRHCTMRCSCSEDIPECGIYVQFLLGQCCPTAREAVFCPLWFIPSCTDMQCRSACNTASFVNFYHRTVEFEMGKLSWHTTAGLISDKSNKDMCTDTEIGYWLDIYIPPDVRFRSLGLCT